MENTLTSVIQTMRSIGCERTSVTIFTMPELSTTLSIMIKKWDDRKYSSKTNKDLSKRDNRGFSDTIFLEVKRKCLN